MDKALDDIIQENKPRMRRFQRTRGTDQRNPRRNFRQPNREQPFRNRQFGFRQNNNRNQRQINRPFSSRFQNRDNRRYQRGNNFQRQPRVDQNFGYNNGMKVCIYEY